MAKPRKSRTKTTAQTTGIPVGALIPQPHGGALRNGGTNRGGHGVIPSTVRQKALGSFDKRIPVLEQIADGTPIDEAEIPFFAVLPHVKCPKCETQMEANDPAALFTINLKGLRSARPGDRQKAVDTLAKYGLGEKNEISLVHPDVKARLQETVLLLHERAPELLTELEKIWQ